VFIHIRGDKERSGTVFILIYSEHPVIWRLSNQDDCACGGVFLNHRKVTQRTFWTSSRSCKFISDDSYARPRPPASKLTAMLDVCPLSLTTLSKVCPVIIVLSDLMCSTEKVKFSFDPQRACEEAALHRDRCCHMRESPLSFALTQFSLFWIAQCHKLRISLRGLYNLYTYDLPLPGPHMGSRKTPKNEKKPFQGEKRGATFKRATEEDPSPWEDRSNKCHV